MIIRSAFWPHNAKGISLLTKAFLFFFCRLNILAKPSFPCSCDKKLMCWFPYHRVCQFDLCMVKNLFMNFARFYSRFFKTTACQLRVFWRELQLILICFPFQWIPLLVTMFCCRQHGKFWNKYANTEKKYKTCTWLSCCRCESLYLLERCVACRNQVVQCPST